MKIMNIIRSLFARRILCRKCGRPLTNKKDRARGISARCLAKEEAHKAEQIASTKPMPTMVVLSDTITKPGAIIHMDYAPTEDCTNPDTYGEVCVKCNACGRFSQKEVVKQEGLPHDSVGNIIENITRRIN